LEETSSKKVWGKMGGARKSKVTERLDTLEEHSELKDSNHNLKGGNPRAPDKPMKVGPGLLRVEKQEALGK